MDIKKLATVVAVIILVVIILAMFCGRRENFQGNMKRANEIHSAFNDKIATVKYPEYRNKTGGTNLEFMDIKALHQQGNFTPEKIASVLM